MSWPALTGLLLVLLGTAAARTAATRKATAASAVYTVTATAYEAVAGQTDSKPFVTADNSRIPRGYGSHTRWLALSRDLLRPWGGPFEFGDKVRVEGISPALDGVYTVHDTMNRRYRHRLDVLAHPREHLNLARTGVKLRRVSAARASTTAARKTTRRAAKSSQAIARRTPKRQPYPAKARQPAKQAPKRHKPGNALVSKTKRANPRPAARARHQARATRALAASPKRPQRRRAATLLAARR